MGTGHTKMKVLIADEDRVALHVRRAKLIKWQYTVVACSNGEEAWSVLQSDSPPQ